jgi:hypothetical protein
MANLHGMRLAHAMPVVVSGRVTNVYVKQPESFSSKTLKVLRRLERPQRGYVSVAFRRKSENNSAHYDRHGVCQARSMQVELREGTPLPCAISGGKFHQLLRIAGVRDRIARILDMEGIEGLLPPVRRYQLYRRRRKGWWCVVS